MDSQATGGPEPGHARSGSIDGAPVPTDGPFAEIKESLAGYWVIEATEERAVEIASRVVAYTELPDGGPADHGRAAAQE